MEILKLNEVYGISRDLPRNYVIRKTVDDALVEALTHDEHIVIYGTSKQGKTSVRKYSLFDHDYLSVVCLNRWTLAQLHAAVLKSAGFTVEGASTRTVTGENKANAKLGASAGWGPFKANGEAGAEVTRADATTTQDAPLELDLADVNDIIGALDFAGAPKVIVLDDFHYLPEQTQEDFAVALKAFHEESKYTFIVSGVWLDPNRLLQYNGDLGGRVTSINADEWSREELSEVITTGAELLNVEFSDAFVDGLLDNSFDSVWVVQDVCRRACIAAGVNQTSVERSVIDIDAAVLIKSSVDMHSARFNGFLTRFADGFRDTELEMYRWLLFVVISVGIVELEHGLSLANVGRLINASHPQAPLKPNSVNQALHFISSLQVSNLKLKPIILDYDETDRKLNVVDKTFLIWLQHQPSEELYETIGLSAPNES